MIIVWILIGLILLAMTVAVVETRILGVKRYSAAELAVTGDAQAVGTVRVVVVSDLHCTRFGSKNRRLIDLITAQKPDLVIVAGDVINSRPSDTEYSKEFFDGLKASGIETVYIFGNHEQKLSLIGEEEFNAYVNELGSHVRIVNNDTFVFKGITIKGLLIPLRMYRDKLSNIETYFKATELIDSFEDDGNYHILVAHDPTFAPMYKEIGADLIIGGHLHGGIIRLPFIGGLISPRHRLFPRRTKGLFEEGKGKLLVTSGVGWHALPFRFLNYPEICVLEVPAVKAGD